MKLKAIGLFVIACLFQSIHSQTTFTVAAKTIHKDNLYPGGYVIWPMCNRYNIMDITRIPTDFTSPMYDFLEEAVLITATGGRPADMVLPGGSIEPMRNEMYDLLGNPTPNFNNQLKPGLDRLMEHGIKPIIVIGNTPVMISSRKPGNPVHTDEAAMGGPDGFKCNIGEPTDYTAYNNYIKALLTYLQANYTNAAVPFGQWEFRLMQEPDNLNWWNPSFGTNIADPGNLNKYASLYENTYASMKTVMGSSVKLSFGNMLLPNFTQNQPGIQYPSWSSQLAIQFGTLIPANKPNVPAFSYSMYSQLQPGYMGGVQMTKNPRDLGQFINGANGLRTKTKSYYPEALINLDETGLTFDENGNSDLLNPEADGTNLGSAWLAAMLKQCYDQGVNRYVLWSDFVATNDLPLTQYVKTPLYNTLVLYKRLRGMQRIKTTGPATGTSYPYFDIISGSKGKYINTLVFSYDPNRNNAAQTPVTVSFSQLDPRGTYRVKEYRIDATHSNYTPTFYADVGGLAGLKLRIVPRSDGSIPSEYSVSVAAATNDATKQIFELNLLKYQAKASLENTYTRIITASSTGTYNLTLYMAPNTVVFYELIPASPVPSITSP